jgi:signal transduction histidine kinase
MLLADVMHDEAAEDDPRREDLEMITEQARRCKGIVFDLLSFARENRVMAQETDLNRLVESVIAEQTEAEGRPTPEYEDIYVALDLDPRLPIIQADSDQLRQCLLNLMSNAVDAMASKGGKLTVSTRIPDSMHVELTVSDTGEGMSEEVKSKLFTPFYTTKPPGKGTGLGLSIIYGIVKMHRGDIQVQSELGRGTTFSIVLPVRLPDASRARATIGA